MRASILQFVRSYRELVLILLAFAVLGVTYSITTPILEAGDELWHYPFVQHLATGNGLPVQDPNVKTLWEQEGGQPPLYYALSALATFWIDARDLPERVWRNPHARIGIPLDFGNKNMIVHTSAENFPWRNTTLAVHLLRWLSLLLATGTVALTFFFALEIQNDRRLAAFAAACVAFNPMFLFISASVNNDNLATLLATLALWLLAQLVTRGATLRRFVILGVVLGLGALTKISNLGLLGVAAIVFAWLFWQSASGRAGERASERQGDKETRRPGDFAGITVSPRLLVALSVPRARAIIVGSLTSAALVIAIAFWWYARNGILYGDLLAFNVWVQIAGGRPAPVTLASLLGEFQGFRISYWGNFGGVNLIAPEWVYRALDAFTVLAALGLLIGIARRTLPRLTWLPATWLVLILISLVRWTWITMASQGRLIFPAIAAVAVLLATGLGQFKIQKSKIKIPSHALPFAFCFLLFTFALLAPFTLIAPAYALPARLADEARVPHKTHITFDDQAELVGYALPQKTIAPGAELPLTIYWRARAPIAEDFSVYVRLFDAHDQILARWDAFPGRGLYPTNVWQPGEIVADEYRIPLPPDARAGVGRIEAGLFRRVPLTALTARDPQGQTITPTLARFKIAGQAQTQVRIENATDHRFGDQIALVGFARAETIARGETLRVQLFWRALAPIAEDYTVFVHLVDASGNIVAQKDDLPQRGAYPTAFWSVGEIVPDEYALVFPRDAASGEYVIRVGVYRASDGARLPTAGGDAIRLTTVRGAQ